MAAASPGEIASASTQGERARGSAAGPVGQRSASVGPQRLGVRRLQGEDEYEDIVVYQDAAAQTCLRCAAEGHAERCSHVPAGSDRVGGSGSAAGGETGAAPSRLLYAYDATGRILGFVVNGVVSTSLRLSRNAAYVAANTTLSGGIGGITGAVTGLATATLWAALDLAVYAAKGSLSLTAQGLSALHGAMGSAVSEHGPVAAVPPDTAPELLERTGQRPRAMVNQGVQATLPLTDENGLATLEPLRISRTPLGSSLYPGLPLAGSVILPSAPPGDGGGEVDVTGPSEDARAAAAGTTTTSTTNTSSNSSSISDRSPRIQRMIAPSAPAASD